jgi:nucleotide-binding universal stress UspA family protein
MDDSQRGPEPDTTTGAGGDTARTVDATLAPDGVDALVGGRVVVGVDDSEQAAAALRWALAEGALRGATVEVVHAWSPPMSALPFGATLVVPVDEAAIDEAVREQLDAMVATATQSMTGTVPEVQVTVLPGAPAATLVEVADGADLLVVGSHGRSALARFVLGSVAMACVQHARSPVVVVRVPAED